MKRVILKIFKNKVFIISVLLLFLAAYIFLIYSFYKSEYRGQISAVISLVCILTLIISLSLSGLFLNRNEKLFDIFGGIAVSLRFLMLLLIPFLFGGM